MAPNGDHYSFTWQSDQALTPKQERKGALVYPNSDHNHGRDWTWA